MKLPWYMKAVKFDREKVTFEFHWIWVLWQKLKKELKNIRKQNVANSK